MLSYRPFPLRPLVRGLAFVAALSAAFAATPEVRSNDAEDAVDEVLSWFGFGDDDNSPLPTPIADGGSPSTKSESALPGTPSIAEPFDPYLLLPPTQATGVDPYESYEGGGQEGSCDRGEGGESGPSQVPEPATGVLVVFGAAAAALRCRRRRRGPSAAPPAD